MKYVRSASGLGGRLGVISAGVLLASTTLQLSGASGALMLTQEAMNRGFQLSVFASGFPSSNNIGPLGIEFPTDGGVLVTTFTGNVQRFVYGMDNQNAATTPVIHNYGGQNAIALARIGDSMFMTQRSPNRVVELAPGYASVARSVATLPGSTADIVVNPANNHLIVSTLSGNAIIDLNPVTGMFSTLAAASADGLTISSDGAIVYAAVGGHVLGYSTAGGGLVFDSGAIPGGVDGTAIGYGAFSGNLFANTNDGRVWEINIASLSQTLIATGGSRGDFVRSDPAANGDLYVTQTSTIVRLTNIPAPASGIFLGVGALPLLRRRR